MKMSNMVGFDVELFILSDYIGSIVFVDCKNTIVTMVNYCKAHNNVRWKLIIPYMTYAYYMHDICSNIIIVIVMMIPDRYVSLPVSLDI